MTITPESLQSFDAEWDAGVPINPQFRIAELLRSRAVDLSYDLQMLTDLAMSPISSDDSADGTIHLLSQCPGVGGDYFLLGVSRDSTSDPERRLLASAWKIRNDLVRRVGETSPLLLMQEFAQEVGEVIEVGNQRNRFIFSESIPIAADLTQVDIRTFAHVVGNSSSDRRYVVFEIRPRQAGNQSFADVRYAYAVPRTRYIEWLKNEEQKRKSYDRVFISYGEPDSDFALKLRNELTRYDVDCWLYQLDATDGRRSWEEITEEIHQRDRTIVVCSRDALVREGSLKEIETVIDHDLSKIMCVSVDVHWQAPGFHVRRGTRDLKAYLLERNYADFTHSRHFGDRTLRLLKALEKQSD